MTYHPPAPCVRASAARLVLASCWGAELTITPSRDLVYEGEDIAFTTVIDEPADEPLAFTLRLVSGAALLRPATDRPLQVVHNDGRVDRLAVGDPVILEPGEEQVTLYLRTIDAPVIQAQRTLGVAFRAITPGFTVPTSTVQATVLHDRSVLVAEASADDATDGLTDLAIAFDLPLFHEAGALSLVIRNGITRAGVLPVSYAVAGDKGIWTTTEWKPPEGNRPPAIWIPYEADARRVTVRIRAEVPETVHDLSLETTAPAGLMAPGTVAWSFEDTQWSADLGTSATYSQQDASGHDALALQEPIPEAVLTDDEAVRQTAATVPELAEAEPQPLTDDDLTLGAGGEFFSLSPSNAMDPKLKVILLAPGNAAVAECITAWGSPGPEGQDRVVPVEEDTSPPLPLVTDATTVGAVEDLERTLAQWHLVKK